VIRAKKQAERKGEMWERRTSLPVPELTVKGEENETTE
jgi:hypothetical protein